MNNGQGYLATRTIIATLSLLFAIPASSQTTPPEPGAEAPTAALPAATPTHATLVGSPACASCHEEQVETFQSNVHHQAEIDGELAGDHVGCEGCHGPGSLHVAAGGDEDDPGFRTVRDFRSMKAGAAAAVCQSCHKTGEPFYWAQSTHARNGVACQNCHTIHEPKSPAKSGLLKSEKPTDLCVSCHQDKHATLARTAHMPLREGGMTCADCHNPHGSTGPHEIRAASNVELCASCHADKRGPFLWEHPPVREDCATCHKPHGSNNDKVLAGKRPFLCQRCHISTRHPSTLYDQPDLASNRLFNRSCTNCHTQVHGSNHPSGKFFLR